MNRKLSIFCILLFAFSVVFIVVLRGFSSSSGSDSMGVPNVAFKKWKVGRSDEGTDTDNAVHISFITSTETTCWFSASVGYVGGSQPDNTSPIDPKTVTWTVPEASHKMKLDTTSVTKNWTGADPSSFDANTSFNVVAKLTVPSFNRNTSCTEPKDANRKDRKPVHRGGKNMKFKIKFTAQTKAGDTVEKELSLEADPKDQIRQEYVDFNRPIPTRENNAAKLTSWAGENTYDFGHYKTMMDHGLDGYFQAWIDAMNKDYRKGKKDAQGTPLSTLEKSDFKLNSGYRNPHHNHQHSGSTGLSSHMYGYALDVAGKNIDGVAGADQSKMVLAAYAADPKARFSQQYTNKTHVHADWAPDTPVKWKKRKKTAADPPTFELPKKTETPMTTTSSVTASTTVFSYTLVSSDGVYTAFSGDSHTADLSVPSGWTQIYWYLKSPSETGLGTSQSSVSDSTGNSTSASYTYSFPSGVSGDYVLKAYVYLSDSTIVEPSYTVSVSLPSSTPPSSPPSETPSSPSPPSDPVVVPVWSDIPDPYNLTVGDSFYLDLSSYVTGSPTFTRNGGVIPAGLSFSYGVISGTVTSVESRGFRFTATNSAGSADSEWINITVSAAP